MQGRTESSRRISAIANRLRTVQLDFADDDAESRRDHLRDTLDREMAGVPVGEREALLAQLLDRFPTWDAQVDPTIRDEEARPSSEGDRDELSDVSFLVSRLVALAPDLDEAHRQVLCDRLGAAGLVARSASAETDVDDEDLREWLALSDGGRVDAGRAVAVLALLGRTIGQIDRVAWRTWHEAFAHLTNIRVRGTARVEQQLRQVVRGDADCSIEKLSTDLRRLSALIASLVYGIKQGGGSFASQHAARLDPDAIEQYTREFTPGLNFTFEKRCWQVYRERTAALDAETIEREILRAVAEYAAELFGGGPLA